jgi:hypothetical protein
VDGPLGGCTAFYDADGDYVLDSDEPVALNADGLRWQPGLTDDTGHFSIRVDAQVHPEPMEATSIIIDPYYYLRLNYSEGAEEVRAGAPMKTGNLGYAVARCDEGPIETNACMCKDKYTGLKQLVALASVAGSAIITPLSQLAYSWLQYLADEDPGTLPDMTKVGASMAESFHLADRLLLREADGFAKLPEIKLDLPTLDPYGALDGALDGSGPYYGEASLQVLIGMAKVSSLATQLTYVLAGLRVNASGLDANKRGVLETALREDGPSAYYALATVLSSHSLNETNDAVKDGLLTDLLLQGLSKQGLGLSLDWLGHRQAGVEASLRAGMSMCLSQYELDLAYPGVDNLRQLPRNYTENSATGQRRGEEGELVGEDFEAKQQASQEAIDAALAAPPTCTGAVYPFPDPDGSGGNFSNYTCVNASVPLLFTNCGANGTDAPPMGHPLPNCFSTRISEGQQLGLQELLFEVTRTAYVCNGLLPAWMQSLVRGQMSAAAFDAEITPAGFDDLLTTAEKKVTLQVGRTFSPKPPPLPPRAPAPMPPPSVPANPKPAQEVEAGATMAPLETWLPFLLLGIAAFFGLLFLGYAYHTSGGMVLTWLRLQGSHSNPSIVAGYLPKETRDKMREQVRLAKRAHDDPLVKFQQEEDKGVGLGAQGGAMVVRKPTSSCGSSTVRNKEEKKDVYDFALKVRADAGKTEEEEPQEEMLPDLGLDDNVAVQRLLQSAYNAQRAFILAAEAQAHASLDADLDDAEAQEAMEQAAEERREAEAAADRLKAVFAGLTAYQAQRAFVAAAEAAASALEAAEEEEKQEEVQLEEIKLKMEAKGLLAPGLLESDEDPNAISATYGYSHEDETDRGEEAATGDEGTVPEDGASLLRPRRRKTRGSVSEAELEGVDQEDAATVNLLLRRVGAGLETIDGQQISAIQPGDLVATTPFQVQRAFVAAAEAALKAVEATRPLADAQRGMVDGTTARLLAMELQDRRVLEHIHEHSGEDGLGGAGLTPEGRARAQLDAIMGRTQLSMAAMDMSDSAAMPSVLAAQQMGSAPQQAEADETEAEAARRIAWIKHYIKLGDYDRAIELGWDGDMDFAASLLNPGTDTPAAETPTSQDMGSGMTTPQLPFDEPPPNVGAGGAEGGTGLNAKQLCRI